MTETEKTEALRAVFDGIVANLSGIPVKDALATLGNVAGLIIATFAHPEEHDEAKRIVFSGTQIGIEFAGEPCRGQPTKH